MNAMADSLALALETESPPHTATYTVRKMTYSDGRAYRYYIADEADRLVYIGEPTGASLPSPTRLVEFFDPAGRPAGRLQPPDLLPWMRATHYKVFATAEEPYAIIHERWRLVDILLLRLPRYELQLGNQRYTAIGGRYGYYLYQIFPMPEEEEQNQAREEQPAEEKVTEGPFPEHREKETQVSNEEGKPRTGTIRCPSAGPDYIIEIDDELLSKAALLLAALVTLIDMDLH